MSLSTLTAMTGVLSQRTFWHIMALVRWGVNSKINDGWIPFGCSTLTVLTLFMLLFFNSLCNCLVLDRQSDTSDVPIHTKDFTSCSHLVYLLWAETGEGCEKIQVFLVLPKKALLNSEGSAEENDDLWGGIQFLFLFFLTWKVWFCPSWGTKRETKPLFIFYHESKNVCMEGEKIKIKAALSWKADFTWASWNNRSLRAAKN